MMIYIENPVKCTKCTGIKTEFGKAAEYSINIGKSVLFVYNGVNNQCYNSTKNIKYLEINLIKNVQQL